MAHRDRRHRLFLGRSRTGCRGNFFRGLLCRTLHRELGDWGALVLIAAFFAIIHPPFAWIPGASVGILAAWPFQSGRHLLPCIACHAAYNATVVTFGA